MGSSPSAQAVLNFSHGKDLIHVVRAEGPFLFDEQGRRFIDAAASAAIVNIGQGVPEILEAINRQFARLSYTYAGRCTNQPAIDLAQRLLGLVRGDYRQVFFASGGSEAIESAMKLAVQYHANRNNTSKLTFLGCDNSYHGNTLGALMVGGRASWRKTYQPYLQFGSHVPPAYCYRCPLGLSYPSCGVACTNEFESVLEQTGPENVAAIFVEPIVGTSLSGVTPPPEYLPRLREICDEHDILLIADEVLTGLGRTGRWLASEHWPDTHADLVCLGKGLGAGYTPMGAVLVRDRVSEVLAGGPLTHSYTNAANPLSCAISLAVLEFMVEHRLVERAEQLGEAWQSELIERLSAVSLVGDVRGKGLLQGVEFVYDRATRRPPPAEWNLTGRVYRELLERGVMVARGIEVRHEDDFISHIQLSPPLNTAQETLDEITGTLLKVVSGLAEEFGRSERTAIDVT